MRKIMDARVKGRKSGEGQFMSALVERYHHFHPANPGIIWIGPAIILKKSGPEAA